LRPEIFGFELNGIDKCTLCGQRLEDSNDRDLAKQWPWHATIYQRKKNFEYICGGTLINKRAVISSAECLMDKQKKIPEYSMQIRLSENQLLSRTQFVSNVYKSIIHKDFNIGTRENNIALLMLDSQMKFTSVLLPACLPQLGASYDDAASGSVLGFGKNGKLQSSEIEIFKTADCHQSNIKFFGSFMNQENFCKGQKKNEKRNCGKNEGKFN
jgi:hypothetical protein